AAPAKLKKDLESFSKGDQARLLSALATAQTRLRNLPEADALWSQLASQPGYENQMPVRRLLFELALERGDEAAMKDRLDELERVEGGRGPIWRFCEAARLIWTARQGKKRVTDEAGNLREPLAADRQDWPALAVALGEIEDLKGRPDQAIVHFRKAVSLGERNPRVVRRLIELLYQQQRFEDAYTELRRMEKQS